jgi:hypothetical protein
LGTHRRAKLKRENLMNLLRAQQAKKKWLKNYLKCTKQFALSLKNWTFVVSYLRIINI